MTENRILAPKGSRAGATNTTRFGLPPVRARLGLPGFLFYSSGSLWPPTASAAVLHERKGDHKWPEQHILETRKEKARSSNNCSNERTWKVTDMLGVTRAICGRGKN